MLFFALAAVQAASTPYPSRAVLGAYKNVCNDIAVLERAEATAIAQHWRPMSPAPQSAIGQLVEFGASEARKQVAGQGGTVAPMRVFTKRVAGEDLTLVLSGVTAGGRNFRGCRVYDIGETRQLPVAAAQSWIGRAPKRAASSDKLSLARWEPGFGPGHGSFELYFVPNGSPAVDIVKVTGVALTANYVGAAR